MTTPDTSGGLQTPNTQEQHAPADRADLRMLMRMHMYHMDGAATPGLAEGTNAATFKTANAIRYWHAGLQKAKGATDNLAFSSGHETVNPNADTAEKCIFLVLLDAGGNVTTAQGPRVAASGTATAPKVPEGYTPIGEIEVETNAATSFVPGTTDLGAAGITDTYRDLRWPTTGPSAAALTGTT